MKLNLGSRPFIINSSLFFVLGFVAAIWLNIGTNLLPHDQTSPTADSTTSPILDQHTEFTYDNVLIRLNEARLSHGLPQLKTDGFLSSEAQKDLVNNCPVSSHTTFRAEFDKGVFRNYAGVAEDLASGDNTPQEAINGLLASPTHADIMIGKDRGWTIIGIGIAKSGSTNCVSIIFGK